MRSKACGYSELLLITSKNINLLYLKDKKMNKHNDWQLICHEEEYEEEEKMDCIQKTNGEEKIQELIPNANNNTEVIRLRRQNALQPPPYNNRNDIIVSAKIVFGFIFITSTVVLIFWGAFMLWGVKPKHVSDSFGGCSPMNWFCDDTNWVHECVNCTDQNNLNFSRSSLCDCHLTANGLTNLSSNVSEYEKMNFAWIWNSPQWIDQNYKISLQMKSENSLAGLVFESNDNGNIKALQVLVESGEGNVYILGYDIANDLVQTKRIYDVCMNTSEFLMTVSVTNNEYEIKVCGIVTGIPKEIEPFTASRVGIVMFPNSSFTASNMTIVFPDE